MTNFASRLWIYQSERFPLAKTVPLLAAFSAASVTLSAVLGGRDLPCVWAYIAAFGLVFILFFQLRVCDEIKDGADDAAYRPERPIPRGLVSLREIVGLGIATVPLAIALAWAAGVLWLLAIVWLWLAAMTFEFGVPDWLKSNPVLYLLSHMAIMPLIDLMLTGVEWVRGDGPAPALWLFLALSFSNGCVLELGRKLWSPESERKGVETYSKLWGPKRATVVWVIFVGISFALLLGVGLATGHAVTIGTIGVIGLLACLWAGRIYASDPTPKAEKRVDTIAGLWVFLCYMTAGFVPVLLGGSL